MITKVTKEQLYEHMDSVLKTGTDDVVKYLRGDEIKGFLIQSKNSIMLRKINKVETDKKMNEILTDMIKMCTSNIGNISFLKQTVIFKNLDFINSLKEEDFVVVMSTLDAIYNKYNAEVSGHVTSLRNQYLLGAATGTMLNQKIITN